MRYHVYSPVLGFSLNAFDKREEAEEFAATRKDHVCITEHPDCPLLYCFKLGRAQKDVVSIGSRTREVLPEYLRDEAPCYIAMCHDIRGTDDLEVFIWDGQSLTEANEATSMTVAERVWSREEDD